MYCQPGHDGVALALALPGAWSADASDFVEDAEHGALGEGCSEDSANEDPKVLLVNRSATRGELRSDRDGA